MELIVYFLFLLYLFLPTFVANAIPVLIKNIPFLKHYKKPICEKYLWKNKTWRGLISGIFFAILVAFLQFKFTNILDFKDNFTCPECVYTTFKISYLFNFSHQYYEIISSIYLAILFWFLQWFWALFWDAFKSLFKRKIWIKSWEAWPFFDWIDYIVWSLIFCCFIFLPTFAWIIFLVLFSPIASLIANVFSYFMWWKEVWW